MAIGAGMSCVKYLLFSFNLLFAITGLIIIIVGAKAEINAHPYVNLTDESFYTSAPMIFIIVGLIVFIVAFFGCCGAVKENHCMIVTNGSDDGDVQDDCSGVEPDYCSNVEPDYCSAGEPEYSYGAVEPDYCSAAEPDYCAADDYCSVDVAQDDD